MQYECDNTPLNNNEIPTCGDAQIPWMIPKYPFDWSYSSDLGTEELVFLKASLITHNSKKTFEEEKMKKRKSRIFSFNRIRMSLEYSLNKRVAIL